MTEEVKHKVGRFYNQVGWQQEADGLYQNAQYEDLRDVSKEYIARAHARVGEHLNQTGEYLLDAGSGPVQYEAYLAYSRGYKKRVCLDLSLVAMEEARKNLGEHGLYVVGDVVHLPFKPECFDGIVALHTIHHVPVEEKATCYQGLYACLKPGSRMVTVDGWHEFGLRRLAGWMIAHFRKNNPVHPTQPAQPAAEKKANPKPNSPAGTFVVKNSAKWLKSTLGGRLPFEILPWRSVSVSWLRAVIKDNENGKKWLRRLSRLEERFPHFFGENGQYPMIVFTKPAAETRGQQEE